MPMSPPRIAFRCDASLQIGYGHVMRCANLARALQQQGAEVVFVLRELPGQLADWLVQQGYQVLILKNRHLSSIDEFSGSVLPAKKPFFSGAAATSSLSHQLPGWAGLGSPHDEPPPHAHWLPVSAQEDAAQTIQALHKWGGADWLVVDHYALAAEWELALKTAFPALRVLAIDDLADRAHVADALLDQNFRHDAAAAYAPRIPAACMTWFGGRYALLGAEYAAFARQPAPSRTAHSPLRVLVFLGGVDALKATAVVLDVLAESPQGALRVDVVVGAHNPERELLAQRCAEHPDWHFHCQVPSLAPLLAQVDVAIGAGGVANWERAALGVPSLVLGVADNQRAILYALAEAGYVLAIPHADHLSAAELRTQLRGPWDALRDSALLRQQLAQRSRTLCDGQGALRVARFLRESDPSLRMRRATVEDAVSLWSWRNAPEVRASALHPEEIHWTDHQAWLGRVLADDTRDLLIAERCDGWGGWQPVGVVRYDVSHDQAEVSIYLCPGLAGQGWGRRVLREGEHWLRMARPALRQLTAVVRQDNPASRRLFIGAAYQPVATTTADELWHFAKNLSAGDSVSA